MRKGVLIFGEEMLSILVAFLALMLLGSNFLILEKRTNFYIADERMNLVADNIADMIAKRYVDPRGNVDLVKLNTTFRDKVEVSIGEAHFGSYAPDNVNVYSARRLVFVNNQSVLMEVKVWP
ncbi:MAG: hypothetical protein NT130_01055 [Candidatus Micrarchaeota archaeon]|nr:hypothetical protein [Candidatus Micrarchaeota archaeon]